MSNGWVKFHRQIEEWRWYQDANTFRLFFHLIMKANHEPKQWMDITIDRGQRVTSYAAIAEELGITVSQARTAVVHLKMTGEIAVKTTNKYMLITVSNYGIYQARDSEDDEGEQQEVADEIADKNTGKSQANRRQIATNKNDKNDKKVYTTPLPPSSVSVPYQDIVNLYNATCMKMPRCTMLTDERRRHIKARWGEHSNLEAFTDLFTKAAASDFLNNGNGTWKGANFDWLLKPANFVKVLEGNYDNGRGTNGQGNTGKPVVGYYEPHTEDEYAKFYAN